MIAARQLQRLGARGTRKRAVLAPRLELLADCGHVLTTDREAEAAAAIIGFLDDVEG